MQLTKPPKIRYGSYYLHIKRDSDLKKAQASLGVMMMLHCRGDEEEADPGKKVGKHEQRRAPSRGPIDAARVGVEESTKEIRGHVKGGQIIQGGPATPLLQDMRKGDCNVVVAAHTTRPCRMFQ